MNKNEEQNNKKVAFITGASSGIGREVALRLASSGYTVFAGIRNKTDKTEIESLNSSIKGVYIDVTNSSGIDKAFWYVMKNTDKIDVLVNNAGIVTAGPIEYLPIGKIKEQFNVNTFGVLAVTQKFMPLLKNAKVINISSMAATGIFPYIAPYCASKRAMEILLNSLALENKDNIKVIFVRPAAVKTPIWNKSVKFARETFEEFNEAARSKYEKEFKMLEKNVSVNNDKGIETFVVVDKIMKIIGEKNPKSSYTIGTKAFWSEVLSLFPISFVNRAVKFKLNLLLKKSAE